MKEMPTFKWRYSDDVNVKSSGRAAAVQLIFFNVSFNEKEKLKNWFAHTLKVA